MNKITKTQAAQILGFSRPTIDAMQKRGELPSELTAIDVMQYLEKQERLLIKAKAKLGVYLQGLTKQ